MLQFKAIYRLITRIEATDIFVALRKCRRDFALAKDCSKAQNCKNVSRCMGCSKKGRWGTTNKAKIAEKRPYNRPSMAEYNSDRPSMLGRPITNYLLLVLWSLGFAGQSYFSMTFPNFRNNPHSRSHFAHLHNSSWSLALPSLVCFWVCTFLFSFCWTLFLSFYKSLLCFLPMEILISITKQPFLWVICLLSPFGARFNAFSLR